MLERMISNGEDCVACGEVANVFRLGLRMPESLKTLNSNAEQSFHRDVAKLTSAEVVTDSSKERCWIVKSHVRAIRSGMKCRNVLVWKTPTELAYSRWKRNNVGTGRSHWKSQWLRVHRFLLGSGLPITTVPCKSLQEKPAHTLAAVCDAIGVQYFPGKEKFWESRLPQFGGSPTARSTSDKSGVAVPDSSYPSEFSSLRDEAQAFERVPTISRMMQELRNLEYANMSEDAWTKKPSWATLAFVYALDPVKRAMERLR